MKGMIGGAAKRLPRPLVAAKIGTALGTLLFAVVNFFLFRLLPGGRNSDPGALREIHGR